MSKPKPVKLLSGSDPPIARAGGDAPAQAHIVAMPVRTSGIGRRLDEPIVQRVVISCRTGSRGAVAAQQPVAAARR